MVTKRKGKNKVTRRTKPTARKATARGKRVERAGPVKARGAAAPQASASNARPQTRPNKYVAADIEKKWQEQWEKDRLWHPDLNDARNKFYYFLTMYPYPSGDLHIGHWYAMAPSDVKARYLRMKGHTVFFPMGFDAFGLPAENAAIQRGIHPYKWTMNNIANMRRQMRRMGASFDWEREVVTCDPRYYKWNQWFFVQMWKRGLAYKKKAAVDWCPKDQTVLAREQVVGENRVCERCGTPVIKRDLEQWFLKITAYADELLDFSKVKWPERVKTLQTNWIGRSEGVQFTMPVDGREDKFDVFTTRQDTVFGMTFAVLAPEHTLVEKITTPEQRRSVIEYVAKTRRESEIERLSTEKIHDGVFTGAYAINPMNQARVPIWIADYVLTTYGTGAIMGVPAHDERDFDFAKKYGLEIPVVIAPPNWDDKPIDAAYTGSGTLVNSGEFNGLSDEQGLTKIADAMEARGIGRRAVNYRIRDWLISRQRYWGTPIPVVYCANHGIQPVPENELPVVLPLEGVEFMPTGESPLTRHEEFLDAKCPICGETARRETDTMDTFVDSSWYQYTYVDPYNTKQPINRAMVKKWLPVDQYTGGVEHAVMHLLYTRFWTKVMRDVGLIDFGEPMERLFNQGDVVAWTYADYNGKYVRPISVIERGGRYYHKDTTEELSRTLERMSKSKQNGVAPDELVDVFGTDAVRLYLMFQGPWDEGFTFKWEPSKDWDRTAISGMARWLQRAWTLVTETGQSAVNSQPLSGAGSQSEYEKELRRKTHQTIKRVTDDIEHFRFNTMIAAMMEFTNYLQKARETEVVKTRAWNEAINSFLLMLAPSAPHMTEELWQRMGKPYSIHQQRWPEWDPRVAAEEMFTVVVQVNGKVRDRLEFAVGTSDAEVKEAALKAENVQRHLAGATPRQVIYVPGKIVNVVK
jgi:leucyl-tRNA synthetase